jgi:hypothetical protein
MQCDLLRAGLIPGIKKCVWHPVRVIDWNGLTFNFVGRFLAIKQSRIDIALTVLQDLKVAWPKVTFRTVASCIGKILSMYPVLGNMVQLRSRMLQTFTNIRHFKNLAWDSPIEADFHDLYFLVYEEILYWLAELPRNNARSFHASKPDWLCWTDASEKAIAACAVRFAIAQEPVPLMLDNILLERRDAFGPMGSGANLQADIYPWSQMSSFGPG